jgi:hypothetical protein
MDSLTTTDTIGSIRWKSLTLHLSRVLRERKFTVGSALKNDSVQACSLTPAPNLHRSRRGVQTRLCRGWGCVKASSDDSEVQMNTEVSKLAVSPPPRLLRTGSTSWWSPSPSCAWRPLASPCGWCCCFDPAGSSESSASGGRSARSSAPWPTPSYPCNPFLDWVFSIVLLTRLTTPRFGRRAKASKD